MTPQAFAAFAANTATVPIFEALVTTAAFFVVGYGLSFKSGHKIDIGFLAQFVGATIMVRYAASLWVYHDPLREGLWPIIWSANAVIGAVIAQKSSRP